LPATQQTCAKVQFPGLAKEITKKPGNPPLGTNRQGLIATEKPANIFFDLVLYPSGKTKRGCQR